MTALVDNRVAQQSGGVYFLRAVKRVIGMRVLTPGWQRNNKPEKALAPAVPRVRTPELVDE